MDSSNRKEVHCSILDSLSVQLKKLFEIFKPVKKGHRKMEISLRVYELYTRLYFFAIQLINVHLIRKIKAFDSHV